jgi:prepilin-type N-terminal cleavage/methylation domain-containing protein
VRKHSGFTVIELMLSVAIAGVLAAIAIPMYSDYRDRVNNAEAVSDIAAIQTFGRAILE